MKKRVLNISLILLLASTGSVFAQQGFGTNQPHPSAAVEIKSPNKGLLIPRVSLESLTTATPISNPQKSLLIFNTKVNPTLQLNEGYYYWTGSRWEAFTTASTDLNTKNVTFEVTNGTLVLTDSEGVPLSVNLADMDKQQITTFEILDNHKLTFTLERGGTKVVNLDSYFNSTKLGFGINTTISGDGTANNPYKINVATASTTNLGVVQIGSGINVTPSGVISVPAAPGETTTSITNTIAGHKIADYKNEANATVAINETITQIKQDASGIHYTNESNVVQDAVVVSGNSTNLISTGSDFGALLTSTAVQNAQVKYEVINGNNTTAVLDPSSTSTLQKYKVNVAPASTNAVGVVKPGNGLTVDTSGTLNVTFPASADGTETKLQAGTNTTVVGTGSSTTPYKVNVAPASTNAVGVVKPGNGLTVDTSGTLNVTFPASADGTETKLQAGTNTTVVGTGSSTTPYKVNVAPASTNAVGVVKPGNGLTVDTSGTLNVTFPAPTVDTNTVTTVKPKTGQSYVTVTSNPQAPSLTENRQYEVGVNLATAQTKDAEGTEGVVKPSKQFEVDSSGYLNVISAAPDFFYFPAINIPLNNANGEVDLYGIYSTRFSSTTMPKSPSAESANLSQFVKPVNMIDIYVVYYDTQVISNVNITNTGKMTYTVNPNYVLSDESYMNIVFKLRRTPRQ